MTDINNGSNQLENYNEINKLLGIIFLYLLIL